MRQSKKRQKQVIGDLLLPTFGYNRDEIDLEAEIDSQLTLRENWRLLKQKLGIKTRKEIRADIERFEANAAEL